MSDDLEVAVSTAQYIRIPDPDISIYRIYPLWYFEEALRLRQLVLAQPRLWEDPFEIIGHAIAVDRLVDGRYEQTIINQTLPPAFAQCWSATAESDPLLRSYSRVIKDRDSNRNICPRDEGVRVRSTPRKLMDALFQAPHLTAAGDVFVGSVEYRAEHDLMQRIANTVRQHGLDAYANPELRADLLLMKRSAFAHEAEIRAIYVQRDSAFTDALLRVNVDINEVIDQVTFDPRLVIFERREREATARALGFTGEVFESTLYQHTVLQIVLDR